MSLFRVLAPTAAFAAMLAAQAPLQKAPITANPVVDFKGKVVRVRIAAGQGMPFAEVNGSTQNTKVYLGSMRYLMENQFNPKAGETMEGKGYKLTEGIVAITCTLTEQKKTLQFRDDNGYPLWRGGHHGKAGHESCCGGSRHPH